MNKYCYICRIPHVNIGKNTKSPVRLIKSNFRRIMFFQVISSAKRTYYTKTIPDGTDGTDVFVRFGKYKNSRRTVPKLLALDYTGYVSTASEITAVQVLVQYCDYAHECRPRMRIRQQGIMERNGLRRD